MPFAGRDPAGVRDVCESEVAGEIALSRVEEVNNLCPVVAVKDHPASGTGVPEGHKTKVIAVQLGTPRRAGTRERMAVACRERGAPLRDGVTAPPGGVGAAPAECHEPGLEPDASGYLRVPGFKCGLLNETSEHPSGHPRRV